MEAQRLRQITHLPLAGYKKGQTTPPGVILKLNKAELCNGSTYDSDSYCLGSNPSSAATTEQSELCSVFLLQKKHPLPLSFLLRRKHSCASGQNIRSPPAQFCAPLVCRFLRLCASRCNQKIRGFKFCGYCVFSYFAPRPEKPGWFFIAPLLCKIALYHTRRLIAVSSRGLQQARARPKF